MKKLLLMIIIMAACTFAISAEPRQLSPQQAETVFNAKMKTMQAKLNLTAGQTEQFMPIYRSYIRSIRSIKRPERVTDKVTISSDEAYKALSEQLKYKQRILGVQEKYLAQFKDILTGQQLMKLLKVEYNMQKCIRDERNRRGLNRDGFRRGNRNWMQPQECSRF